MQNAIRAALAAVSLTGAGVAVAVPVTAGGTGNSTNGCYGVWFTRDWEQRCPSPGAQAQGNYRTTADCDNQPDKRITPYRYVNDRTIVDGPDCTFSVGGAFTVFFD